MPRKLIVELVGDSASLERSFRRSSVASKQFGRDFGRTTRGVIAGSGVFRSLGRSIAFASASFLGGAGIIAAVKSTVQAAAKAEAVLGQTEVAVKSAGQSWVAYARQIQDVALAQSKLSAFEDERLLETFSRFIRRTKDVTLALKLNALAANVARGRHIELELASQLVLKASIGAAGALRRLGIDAKKGATAAQLLAILQQKYAGAAAAYGRTASGAQERFRVAIENVQEAIGKGLLPQITELLNKATDWLNNTRNQERITTALKKGIHALGEGFSIAYTLAKPLVQLVSDLAGKLGGWKTTIELLVGAWIGFKAAGIGAAVAVQFANIAAAAGTKAAWRAALIATGWGAFAVAAGIAAAYIITHWTKAKAWFKRFWVEMEIWADEALLRIIEGFSHLPSAAGKWARDLKDQLDGTLDDLTHKLYEINQAATNARRASISAGDAGMIAAAAGFGGKSAKKKTTADLGGLTAADLKALQKSNISAPTAKVETWRDKFEKVLQGFQLAMSRAGLTDSLQDDLRALGETEAAIRHQLSLHKGDLDLQQKLVDVLGQRRDLEKQIAEAQKARIAGKQFRALGLTATGDDAVPGVKGLRKLLGNFEKNVSGTFLDTKKTKSVISRIRKVLSGGLGAVGRDVRDKIKQILADLDQQLKDHAGDRTKFRHANTAALLAGLGLSPDQVRAVRARIATVGPGGVVPGGAQPAYAMAIGTVHVHGVQDPRKFEEHMRKRARSRPSRRRGT